MDADWGLQSNVMTNSRLQGSSKPRLARWRSLEEMDLNQAERPHYATYGKRSVVRDVTLAPLHTGGVAG